VTTDATGGCGGDPAIFTETDSKWMKHALMLAGRAEDQGEVPVGAVVVCEGQLAGEGWNRSITLNDPSAHAEIMALRDAGQRRQNYRLPACVMYVTLEPCAMCVSAAIHARLERVIFGAADAKTGVLGGAYSLPDAYSHNHGIKFTGGLLEKEAAKLLRSFFHERRKLPAGSAGV